MKDQIVEFIQKHTVANKEEAAFIADYAIATWRPLPPIVKYLRIFDEKSRNTRWATVMASICRKPLVQLGTFSSHDALLYSIRKHQPTTLILDMDIPRREIKRLIPVLQAGAEPDRALITMYSEQAVVTKCFGYKVLLGGISFSNHPGINSRCLSVRITHPASELKAWPEDVFTNDARALRYALMNEYEHEIDLSVMHDFDTNLYGWGRMSNQLTDRQQLQLEIASISNTSLEDAKSSVGKIGTLALRHAIALARKSERKGLVTMIARELKKRGEEE